MSLPWRRFEKSGVLGSPQDIPGLQMWLDAFDSGSLIKDASNAVSLSSDKSGNSGVNCLVLNGAVNNWASIPDVAAFAGATELDVKMRLMPTAAYLATPQQFCGQYQSTGNQRGFIFGQGYFGADRFYAAVSGDGVTGQVIGSNLSLPAGYRGSDLTAYWCRFTWRASDQRVQFFYAPDSAVVPTSWTQSGTSVTLPGAIASVFNSTGLFGIGGIQNQAAAENIAGNYYYCSVATTIGGANAVEIDFTLAPTKLAGTVTATTGQTVTINTTGATGARISGARDLYQGTAANQPIYLPWSGGNYGWLPVAAANSFSAPDAAATDLTSDMDIRVECVAADWTTAAGQTLVSKYDYANNQRSYLFGVTNTTGTLYFRTAVLGTVASFEVNSGVAPYADGVGGWVRVTYDQDTGAGQYAVKFYTSPDGVTWTQLGATATGASIAALFVGTAPLVIGAVGNPAGTQAEQFGGRISRAMLYNGIAGTLVFDFNPSAYVSGTTFLDSAGGATITLNGGSTIVTRSCLYFDGSNDYLKSAAFALAQPETVYFVGSQVTATANEIILDGEVNNRSSLFQTGIGVGVALYAGSATTTNNGWALNTNAIITALFNGASSLSRVNRLASVGGNAGAGSPNGFTLGAGGTAATPANITASSVLVYNRVLSEDEHNRLMNWFERNKYV